jgi:putative SOS response-associated peptidase YedK
VCGEGQKPISHNADHYPSRERSGRHLRQSTTDRMHIDPRNSLHESVPSVPQEFEVRATKIYPSCYCRNHSKKSDVVVYVIGGRKPINAKCETVGTLPTFRDAYRLRRCILPVDGFYEWKAIKGQRAKQPYAIAMKDGAPFGIAGLWENWKDPAFGEWIRTFAVITTDANELVADIHDRMPAILAPGDYTRWLSDEPDPRDLMRPFPARLMRMWPISTRVNKPENDDPSIIEPIELASDAGTALRRLRNNKNHAHVAISGAASESSKRHEPVAQVRRSGDRLRLHHSNHRIDVRGVEPEHLFAVNLPLCQLRQVPGKALLERLP